MRVVREDFQNHVTWSYAECGAFAGVSVGTICKWVSAGKRYGKKVTRLPIAFRRGPFRIDALVFQKYLRKEI